MTQDLCEVRAIAKEAYIYGWPMSEAYNTMYDYAIDESAQNSNYKAPFNEIKNEHEVYTADDDAVVTPNSDTPYSFIWADLRAQPVVLTVPEFPKIEDRYYSFQLIDLYTHNFEYIGTRATGRDAGKYLIAGPSWEGEIPDGITDVFRSETEFVFSITRTQLFDSSDMNKVIEYQDQYSVETLSQFLGTGSPAVTLPEIVWPEPIRGSDAGEPGRTPAVFKNINFMLQFCPTQRCELVLMDRFAKIGVGPGLTFDESKLSQATIDAIQAGIEDAWAEFELVNGHIDEGDLNCGDLFGTRQFLLNNYLYRFAGAKIGLFGNSREEALYPMYFMDSNGVDLNGSTGRYTLNLKDLPAQAFASVTMYDSESQLLIHNEYQPVERYLINTALEDSLEKEKDGSVTIYIQRDAPGEVGTKEYKNWLPAPDGLFYMAMRLYVPEESALDGSWSAPPVEKVGSAPNTGESTDARSRSTRVLVTA